MKISPSLCRLLGLTAVIFSANLSMLVGGERKVVPSTKIRQEVIDKELSRSWPVKRQGFDGPSRSMIQVKVDPEANISIPIEFVIGTTTPKEQVDREQLGELAKALQGIPLDVVYLVEGHTCCKGENEKNDQLSIDRANAVKDYLVKSGVPPGCLKVIGCGQAQAEKDHVQTTDSETVLTTYRKVMLHRIVN